jgi:hypothetical protein
MLSMALGVPLMQQTYSLVGQPYGTLVPPGDPCTRAACQRQVPNLEFHNRK